MSAGAVVGGAIVAVLLVAIPPGEPDPGYAADCTQDGTVTRVEPDTRANREAATAWCAELAVFQRADQFAKTVADLWGK